MLLLGAAAFFAVRMMPAPDGLQPAAQRALAVFVVCLVYWVTNVLPLMVTSLLAMVLLPLTGVLSAKDTYALFGNEAVFFILGAFILAAALMKLRPLDAHRARRAAPLRAHAAHAAPLASS